MGLVASRKRGRAVLESLTHGGMSPEAVARVRFPAGLDIMAERGDEIALSIMAEIVKTRRSAERLGWKEEPPVASTAIDPVCGMTVQPAGSKHQAEHAGVIYHFCCSVCRARFAADPIKYLAASA